MKKIIAITLLALLTACQDAPSGYKPEPFAFELNKSAPLNVNVAEIKIVDAYQSPLRAPNIEHEFPVPPAVAIRKWAASRLKATGSSGVLEISINDASVKEVSLPKTQGIKGLLTNDQDARYDASILVNIRLFSGARAISDASADITVTRSRSISEKATVNQREQIYHQMTRDVLANFDSEAGKRLHQYFAAYLK